MRGFSHSCLPRFRSAANEDFERISCALVTFHEVASSRAVTNCEVCKPDLPNGVLVVQLVRREVKRVSECGICATVSIKTDDFAQKRTGDKMERMNDSVEVFADAGSRLFIKDQISSRSGRPVILEASSGYN